MNKLFFGGPARRSGPFGIIAGEGRLPEKIARRLKEWGRPLLALSVGRPAPDPLEAIADRLVRVQINQADLAMSEMKAFGVKRLVLAGKITRTGMHNDGFEADKLTGEVIRKAGRHKGDDRLMKAAAFYLGLSGIRVVGPGEILLEDLVGRGVLTGGPLSPSQRQDIQTGLKMARVVGRLDIGQTVVVKDGCVLSVEALEGTDRAIRRVADLGIRGAVVVKVAKPQQDLRFDLPTLGAATLESAVFAGCSVIAAQAGRALIIDRQEVLSRAREYNVTFVGV